MTAEKLIAAAAEDSFLRLKWQVLRRLGICPASLRAHLLTKRRVLLLACQMVLDNRASAGSAGEENPNFDMARFKNLAGG